MDPSHTRLGADTGRPDGILRGQNATETLGLNPDSGLYTKYYALSQIQKQQSILKDLNTAFLVLNPKKSLILSVEEDLGLIFYTKKLLVFSAALCVLCGEKVLEVGFPNKGLCISLQTSVVKMSWKWIFP